MALFTPQIAAEMAQRSHASRKQRQERLVIAANPVPLPADNSYTERRLARVREQIEMLSGMLDNESEPQKLDRLANAISRMSELERQLANRPLPGSFKPSAARPQSRRMPEPIPLPTIYSVQPTPAEPEMPKSLGSNETH